MDWNRIEGGWKQFSGKVKEQWGKLTDDDITQINGNREQLEGKIQERYGKAKDEVRKEVDDWSGRLN
ncbi:CsbD family protein [Devosia honganensis]|uniref:CsbD family protein n=1 Tax=Devosia honganensis TaxID=1610527 RepID=A0ABV7WYI8_9HYPH